MSFILSLFILLIVGAFVAAIFLKQQPSEFFSQEFLGLSFFIGLGLINFQFFSLYLLNLKFDPLSFILTQAAIGILVLYYFIKQFKNKERLSSLSGFSPLNGVEKLFLAGIFFQFCWIFYLTLPVPVSSFDALASYAFKAKIFYLENGVPAGFFNWSEVLISHPDYPTLLPFFMTWVYLFTGFNDLVVVNIMPVTFAFFLVLFYSQLKKFFDRRYALAATFVIVTIPQVCRYATIIHADIFLLAFITCAFLYFMFYIRYSNREFLIFSSILFALSIWVKNEAVVFVFAFLLCLAIRNKAQGLRHLGLAILVIFLISGPWFMIKFSKHMVNSDINFSALTLDKILANIKDIPIMLDELQKQVFGPKNWNIFWVVVIGAISFNFKKLFKGEIFYISLFLAVCISCYFIAYMLTTQERLDFYLEKTLLRFMIHFAGVFLFLTVYLFWDKFRKIEEEPRW
ncbi:MAG: glycosyltransferase family 39 protein [Candidatus Omnitrophica bacterium]|nr:glycosyltransferase family 39 protein [Candidatus Omnitrophota bacterium]